EEIEQKIKEIHVFEIPEIIMIPIEKASDEYIKWIADQVE
ncbi:MAG: divalent cation tolerance protein CutA, partial [Asgard group archaeon]|nr:divalent cation tolerance protein CutA [Asgard group archaeon]